MTFDELVEAHTPRIANLTRRIRRLVRRVLPDAEERVYAGWHGAGYHDPSAGYVCGIFPREDRVELGFEHGARLPDPEGILQRGGKQVRYAVFTKWEPRRAEEIAALVERAVLIGRSEKKRPRRGG